MTRLKCHVLRVFKNKSQHPSICIQSEESELHFPLTNTMQHSSSQANFKKKKNEGKLNIYYLLFAPLVLTTAPSNSGSVLITT